MVQGVQHCKYDDRLNYLELRRVRSDLTKTFKITKGLYDEIFFFKLNDSGRRGHDQKLKRDLDFM